MIVPDRPADEVLTRHARPKKIPAGCPAGEGGMVEEIYIHYCRHLVQEKVTPFWSIFSRNCSGGAFFICSTATRRVGTGLFKLEGLVWKRFTMDVVTGFAAFLERTCRC